LLEAPVSYVKERATALATDPIGDMKRTMQGTIDRAKQREQLQQIAYGDPQNPTRVTDQAAADQLAQDYLDMASTIMPAGAKKPQTTKQELIDYIQANRTNMGEKRLGDYEAFDANRLKKLESEYQKLKEHPIDDPSFGEDKYDELIRLMNIRDKSTTQTLYDAAEQSTRSAQRAQMRGDKKTAEKYFREAEFLNTRAEKLDLSGQGLQNPTKYGQYTLPGGENYREVLLTLPTKRELPSGYKVMQNPSTAPNAQKYIVVDKSGERYGSGNTESDALNKYFEYHTTDAYKSSHWDEPNVMAHLRLNDRVDVDGKKMTLIEEVQSDWHQAGREKGYRKSNQNRIPTKFEQDYAGWNIFDQDGNEITYVTNEVNLSGTKEGAIKIAQERLDSDKFLVRSKSVSDAPMKDTWYQTALRKAVKDAIDQGSDRVGITTGARQAERYDLSKQISEVNYSGTNFVAYDKNGDAVIQRTGVSEADLPDLIGKDAARKLLEQPKQGTLRSLSGVDLQVGGEGMKKYYDDVYPKYLEKFAKKYGSKVSEGSVPIERSRDASGIPSMYPQQEPVKYIEITPEMRKALGGKDKGVPLFGAGALPFGLLAADEEIKKDMQSLLGY
jgi:hypothetical protein